MIYVFFQVDLNHRSTAWQRLQMETNLDILSGLLFQWLETLKHPLLDVDSLSYIVAWSSKPQRCLEKLPPCNRYLLEYLLRFVSRLRPMTGESQSLITKRFMATFTHQSIWIRSSFYPSSKYLKKRNILIFEVHSLGNFKRREICVTIFFHYALSFLPA